MDKMNYLLLTLKRRPWDWNFTVEYLFCIIETTEIVSVIDVACEVGKSLETPRNVIL